MAATDPWDAFPAVGDTPAKPASTGPIYGAPPKPEAPDKPNPGTGYQMKPDGTAAIIPGGEADVSRPAPGDATKTGDEYLKTISPELAAQVKALSEGRRAFPTGSALRDPQMKELVAAATQYDPTLDAANASTRVATRKDFTSGVTAKNITAINTALGHLGTLYDASQGLHNRAMPAWNTIANAAESAVGDPRVNNFNLARQAVVDELERAFRGAGGGTEAGIAAWKESINSSQSPEQLKAAIAQGVNLLNSRLSALGDQYSRGMGSSADPMQFLSPHAQEIYQHLHPGGDGVLPPPGGSPPTGAPGSPPKGPAGGAPPLSPGDPGYQPVTGNTKQVPDPQTQKQVDSLLRQGASYAEVNRFAQSRGMAPVSEEEYQAVHQFLAKNPNYQGSLVNASKFAPVSTAEKLITGAGDNAAGNYFLHAGQFLSGNTLDNMASDPERARLAMSIGDANSPTAGAIGDVSGGVIGSLLGEAGAARLGVGGGLARGLGIDTAVGAANGAGAADYSGDGTPSTLGDRFVGGVKGGVAAGVGSLAGTAVSKGLSTAFNPTGGRLAELYGAGVRPTPGQRLANVNDGKGVTGMMGKAVNATEEALQSVPIVGSAIRGARQEARDQAQIGAFNQALGEIGEELPKGTRPGNDPHKFAQTAFERVYDKARSGMTLVADQELSNDLGQLAPDISALGPEAQTKLKNILANSVNNKLANGQMTGDAYKQASSDLGKRIAQNRKGSMADDQALADVLEGVQGALDGAARRHSQPDAVALLDAADAGYAKLVRIEGAAARRGGESGTFSPAQLDAEVQKASGGIRSKSYLRGDALMQDYAKGARSLEDRMPNSGTTDRALAAGTLSAGAAGYIEPSTLGILGAIGLAYAPGIRKVTTGAMAPSTSATAKAISAQLAKRARIVGRTTAAIGAAHELETSPAQ